MGEMLFYGGIALMGVSAASGVIAIIVFKLRSIRLNARLDGEYGREEENEQ